jgi:hypothetical protein
LSFLLPPPYSPLLSSPLLYSTLLYSTLLYSTLLYSTLLYSTLLYSTLPHHATKTTPALSSSSKEPTLFSVTRAATTPNKMSDSSAAAAAADMAQSLLKSVRAVNEFTPFMEWDVQCHLESMWKCVVAAPTSVENLATVSRCACMMWKKKNQLRRMAWCGLEATGPHADLRAQVVSRFFAFLAAIANADRKVARWTAWAEWLAYTFVNAGSRDFLGKEVVFMALVRAMSTHYSDATDLALLAEPMKADILSVLDNLPCALTEENAAAVCELRDLLIND